MRTPRGPTRDALLGRGPRSLGAKRAGASKRREAPHPPSKTDTPRCRLAGQLLWVRPSGDVPRRPGPGEPGSWLAPAHSEVTRDRGRGSDETVRGQGRGGKGVGVRPP